MADLRILRKLKPTLGFLLSLVFLNVLMNINYPALDLHPPVLVMISPEVLVIFAVICAAAWMGIRFYSFVFLPLTAFVIFLRLFRIGDILVPMYFFRPFNLFIDSQFLPDLIFLLYTTFSGKEFSYFVILTITLLVGITWGVWVSFKIIHNYLLVNRQRRVLVSLTVAGFLVLYSLQPYDTNYGPNIFTRGFFHRVVEEVDFILHVKGYQAKYLRVIESMMKKVEQIPSSLDRLKSANIFIFFIESYGHIFFADERHFSRTALLLDGLEKNLIAHGFSVNSAFLNSPTFGGSSWLAHASLGSGVNLNDQLRYNLLITSKAKTISRFFNDIGYLTISVMPGTQWPWPQGEFFGFQKKYYAWDFDYKGPNYAWSLMPDQYVLDYVYRQEIQDRTKPLFIEFVLVSSHAPFNRQPSYLEDWSQIGNGEIYHESEVITFPIIWPDLSNASEAYVTAISYDLKVIIEFIIQFIKDNTLIVILGDHQPNVQITGNNVPWSVPVHVISRHDEFMRPFQKRGYTPGLVPTQPPPHPGMETFLINFLEDFSTPPADQKP